MQARYVAPQMFTCACVSYSGGVMSEDMMAGDEASLVSALKLHVTGAHHVSSGPCIPFQVSLMRRRVF